MDKKKQEINNIHPTEGFRAELFRALPNLKVDCRSAKRKSLGQNTLAIENQPLGVIFPANETEVEVIINLANRHNVSLYPISRGKNIGYGDSTPTRVNSYVVSLEKMTKISEFDPLAGQITIEPGVTQQQLYGYLQSHGGDWMADVTGAPTSASIIGNTLEAGFGHSSIGNRRKHILEIVAVTGRGEILRSGQMPGVGPDLAPLFVQSGFGIVTSMRIPLFRVRECARSYVIQFESFEKFCGAIPHLQKLRTLGYIQSLLHCANATRVYMSTHRFPEGVPREVALQDKDCQELMTSWVNKPGLWSAVGGLYGSKAQVRDAQKSIQKTLRPYAKVQFFTPKKFKVIKSVLKWIGGKKKDQLINSINSLDSIHFLNQGIPSDEAYKNILWRSKNYEDLGLIWSCPIVKAEPGELSKLIEIAKPIFERFKFEMPLTVTLINAKSFIGIFSLNFDRSNKDEVTRAHKAYKQLSRAFSEAGFNSYRKGLLGDETEFKMSNKDLILKDLKRLFDPKDVICSKY